MMPFDLPGKESTFSGLSSDYATHLPGVC